MVIPVSHRIREAAFRVAAVLKADEQFMEDVDTNIIAIETGKRSAMTLLWDMKHIKGLDTSVFPKVGSREPKAKADVNMIYDHYETADKKTGRYFYDLCEALNPGLFQLNRAFTEYNRSKVDNKDELAKAIDDKEAENFFRSFQRTTDDLKAITKKYNRRWSSFTDMVIKAVTAEQTVTRLNTEMTECYIREKKNETGKVIGYDESPTPICFNNKPEIIKDKDAKYQTDLWSVGTLAILERIVKDEKNQSTGYTQLDVLFNTSDVTFKTVTDLLKRETPEEEKTDRASLLKSLKAEKPEEAIQVMNVLAGFFLDYKSDGTVSVIERAENAFLNYVKPASQDEAARLAYELSFVFDSIGSKLNTRVTRMIDAIEDAKSKPEPEKKDAA